MHTANFRYEIIDEVFAGAGVGQINESIINESGFSECLKNDPEIGDARSIEKSLFIKASRRKLQETLNDLAQRRNEMSHGTETDNRLLPEEIQDRYIDFLKQYAQSLGNVLQDSVISFQNSLLREEVESCFRLGSPVHVWQDGKVL